MYGMNSKERIVCHYWYLNHGCKFQTSVCNGCHDLTLLCLNLSDIVIITVKAVEYHCIICDISKCEATNLLEILYFMIVCVYKIHIKEIIIKNRVYNYYFDSLIKTKELETKIILIDEKN